MKTLKYIILLFGTAATMWNCQDLNEDTYSVFQNEQFYKDLTHLEAATYRLYDIFAAAGGWERNMHALSTTQSQYCMPFNKDFQQFSIFGFDASSSYVENVWSYYYKAINQANNILENAYRVNTTEDIRETHLAEAKFIRGYSHYCLTVLFGEVPLRLKESVYEQDAYVGRSPVADIYASVVEDLKYAIDKLPITWTTKGRVTKKAAIFLLGKVYLTMAGYPLRRTECYQDAVNTLRDLVLHPGDYDCALLDDVTEVYSNDNKNNQEILLSWQSSRDVNGSQMPYFLLPQRDSRFASTNKNLASVALIGFSEDLYNLYSATDDRRVNLWAYKYQRKSTNNASTLTTITYNGATGEYNYKRGRGVSICKYIDPESTGNNQSINDKIVYRFAEALLVAAEAYNELGIIDSAKMFLNQVRVRSNADEVTVTTQDEVRAAIRLERHLELVGEYADIFDIRRLGEVESTLQNHAYIKWLNDPEGGASPFTLPYSAKFELFPIPTQEMQANREITSNNFGW